MNTRSASAIFIILGSAFALSSAPALSAGNTKFGTNALLSLNGNNNSAFGESALRNNTSGYDNTAVGYQSLYTNLIGYQNTATGSQSLLANTTGNVNTASGFDALRRNTTGGSNTATGARSLSIPPVSITRRPA